MVARGHRLHDLLCVYPISTLNDLTKAARHNQREENVMGMNGVLAAVMHSLDQGFNKGKGKIMKKYMDKLYPRKSKNIQDASNKLLDFLSPRK